MQGKGRGKPLNATIIVELVLLIKQLIPRQALSCHILNKLLVVLLIFSHSLILQLE